MNFINKPYLLCAFASCLISITAYAQKATKLDYTIAPWFNNKKAAVSLTFDDGIPGQYRVAVPLLNQHGFKGTFFMTVSIVESKHIDWKIINDAARQGHEIGNHALTHPHFTQLSLGAIADESVRSNALMNKYIPAQRMLTHAYPFGEGGGNTAKDTEIRRTVSRYFIGARATQNKPYAYNRYDFAKANDGYYNVNSAMIADPTSMADFGKYIDQTIAVGGWFCPTYHGIADGWIITPEAVFRKHLDEVEKRKADLWIAPFKNVIQYHKERNSAKLTLLSQESKGWVLALTDTLTNRGNFNQPLTINLKVKQTVQSISQGNRPAGFIMNGNYATFNAVPGNYKIVVKFKPRK